MRGLSSASDGMRVGLEPVARMQCSNCSSVSPPAPAIVIDVGPVSVARPWMNFTLRILPTWPTPLVSLSTTPCLNARSLSTSIFGSAKVTPHALAWRASSITLATCSSAFDGMQPRYRQTPPGFFSSSTSVTCMPRSAA